MWENYRLDGQYFNIIRGETLVGEQIKQVPPEVLPAMYAHVSKLTKRYGDRMFAGDDASKRFVKNAVYAGAITLTIARSTQTFNNQRRGRFRARQVRHGGDRLQRRRARV
jgi:hypothetical protein